MAKIEIKSVDNYIAAQPEPTARALELVRSAIRKGLSKAEEVISYKMPAYKLHGEIVLYFAGWKQHYSLYPVGASLLAAFKDELAAYEVDRGTIRFPLNAPVPLKLIEGIARFRAKNDPAFDIDRSDSLDIAFSPARQDVAFQVALIDEFRGMPLRVVRWPSASQANGNVPPARQWFEAWLLRVLIACLH